MYIVLLVINCVYVTSSYTVHVYTCTHVSQPYTASTHYTIDWENVGRNGIAEIRFIALVVIHVGCFEPHTVYSWINARVFISFRPLWPPTFKRGWRLLLFHQLYWWRNRRLKACSMATQCSDSYEKTSLIRGHHIKSIWTPMIGEELVLGAQDDNEHGKHTVHVSVMKDGCVVGHVPHSISQESWFYLKHGGYIHCS